MENIDFNLLRDKAYKIAQRNKRNLEEEVAKIIQNTQCENGEVFLLNPLFVEEMMGFPENWTASPFLNGEKKV